MKIKQKYKLDFYTLGQLVKWHKRNKIPYAHTISRYMNKINSEAGNFTFMRGYKGKKCFVAFTMLKSDVHNNNLPIIKENELRYYQTALKPIYLDYVYSTDVKSAYANILFNDGVISERSFNYLCTLKKPDRLASVGMLASRNTTYYFNRKGEMFKKINYTSPYSNVFFYAVRKTFYIMNECKHHLGRDFLFSWVDCIYYPNKECSKIVSDCLNDYKLKFTDGLLEEFECKEKVNGYKLSFKKEGKASGFYVPKIPELYSIVNE